MKNKITNLFKENITFLFLPNSSKNSKQITINKFLFSFLFTISIIYILFTSYNSFFLSNKNAKIEKKLTNAYQKIDKYKIQASNLNEKLKEKNNKIVSLNEKLEKNKNEYAKKIDELKTLEKEFTYLMTEFNTNNNFNLSVPTSRALPNEKRSLRENKTSSYNDFYKLIKDDIEKYDNLIAKFEEKIEFIECKPDLLPTKGKITSDFGYRKHPILKSWGEHTGVDIDTDLGNPIKAAGAGVIIFSGYDGSYGNVIIISHGFGYKTIYAHNSENLVKEGSQVKKGQIIAKVGNTGRSTGPHVHFEIQKNNKPINPRKLVDFN
ncbi:MAG: peptidoglycan DD-metalloendopeptidase family protein [Bacillota bacterium]